MTPAPPTRIPESLPRQLGSFLNNVGSRVTRAGEPIGNWTGLRPILGAPVSGALVGGGLGLAYTLADKFRRYLQGEETDEPSPWLRNALIGAGLGGGLGLWSGVAQTKSGSTKSAGVPVSEILAALMRDTSLSFQDRASLADAVQRAPVGAQQRIAQLLAVSGGAMAGLVVAKVLGLGLPGRAVASMAGAFIANNLLHPARRYV